MNTEIIDTGKRLSWVLGQLSRAQGEALCLAERKAKATAESWTWGDEWALERSLEDVAALEVEHDDLVDKLFSPLDK